MPQFGILFKVIWSLKTPVMNLIRSGFAWLTKKEDNMIATKELVKQSGNKTKCERQVGNWVIDLIGLIAEY